MSDDRPTYQIASPHIAPYVQPLWHGALPLPFDFHDQDGRRLSIRDDHLSGRYLVLIFMNDDGASGRDALSAIASAAVRLEALSATVVGITADGSATSNRALRDATRFPWPIATDSTGGVFASYGLHKGNDVALRIVLLTPYRQIRTWLDAPREPADMLEKIMNVLECSQVAEEARWATPHAPVLLVPSVLTPQECAQLIANFEKDEPFMVRPPRDGELDGNYKIPVYEHNRQDRVDQILRNKDIVSFLDQRLFSRVTPMIKKAFAYEVTRREDLHIARYVGERGGNEMGHRDNTSPATDYRRFALSMSLNDDYEGGGIVFREYSPRGYRPPAGTALVFSSSLLHEVEETTSGVRYNLISHFFNEEVLRR